MSQISPSSWHLWLYFQLPRGAGARDRVVTFASAPRGLCRRTLQTLTPSTTDTDKLALCLVVEPARHIVADRRYPDTPSLFVIRSFRGQGPRILVGKLCCLMKPAFHIAAHLVPVSSIDRLLYY
ncbi:hypothetical protein LY76DRAFT_161858 [Colletotrichum caudatum]|nr:hypothetical protein LY76DRAFT_161858 [Colletotrichum caudatum]